MLCLVAISWRTYLGVPPRTRVARAAYVPWRTYLRQGDTHLRERPISQRDGLQRPQGGEFVRRSVLLFMSPHLHAITVRCIEAVAHLAALWHLLLGARNCHDAKTNLSNSHRRRSAVSGVPFLGRRFWYVQLHHIQENRAEHGGASCRADYSPVARIQFSN